MSPAPRLRGFLSAYSWEAFLLALLVIVMAAASATKAK